MANRADIALQRNETWVREITLRTTLGVPLDLTGATFDMDIKAAEGAPGAALASATVTLDGPATDGTIRIVLPGSAFAAVGGAQEVVRLAYDLVATQDALSFCILRGAVVLSPGVSNNAA